MLRRITAKYGNEICGDAKRCEGLLKDLCGAYRREINVLVNAIEERVPLDLLAGARSLPRELLLTRLENRLEEQLGMTAEAARWAVESWALALGLATDSEIAERSKQNEPAPVTKPEANKPINPAAGGGISNANRPTPVQPQPKSRINTPSSPAPIPTVIKQSTANPISPPMTANQPVNRAPAQAQTANPVAVSKRKFGVFRGCLIVLFLLIASAVALVFVVPYAIEVMRETQRERNDEPPRFPVR